MNQKNNSEKKYHSTEKKQLQTIIKEIVSPLRFYISSYISLADTKAGFLMGITVGLLTATYLHGPKIFETNLKDWKCVEIFTLIGFLCLVSSICFALFVVWPRTPTSEKEGFFSWIHVASYNSAKKYSEGIISANEEQIIEGLYELNYDLSKVCKDKYIWLEKAFFFSFIGILICTVVLIIQKLPKNTFELITFH